jgi:hypothetical protein
MTVPATIKHFWSIFERCGLLPFSKTCVQRVFLFMSETWTFYWRCCLLDSVIGHRPPENRTLSHLNALGMGELCDNKTAKLVDISFRIRTGHTRNRDGITGGEARRLVRKYDGCVLVINNLCYQTHSKKTEPHSQWNVCFWHGAWQRQDICLLFRVHTASGAHPGW